MSRSVAMVIAYVMHTFSMTADDAHHYVLQRRHCISLNDGFRSQVREYEIILKAQQRQQEMSQHNMNVRNVSQQSIGLPHSPSFKRTRADNDTFGMEYSRPSQSSLNSLESGPFPPHPQPQASGYMANR